MRQFASPGGFRIWNLSREAKLVYSCFGFFSLLGLLSSALLYEDLVGAKTAGIGAYYAGSDGAATSAPATASAPSATATGDSRTQPAAPALDGGLNGNLNGGPRIELPDEATSGHAAAPITVAASDRKLLEVTHFHLFTVPVFLLIVAHLFMLTGLSSSAKVAWIAAGWLSALVHLAAPWAIHWGGGSLAFLYAGSGALLGLSTGVLTVYPIWSMWFGRPSDRSGGGSGEREAQDAATGEGS